VSIARNRKLLSRLVAACCLFVYSLLVGLLCSLPRVAMAQGTTASLTGAIVDPTGALVPDAQVTIRNVDTNAVRVVQSAANGNYIAPQLSPGHYILDVEKAGFQSYEQRAITLTIGQTAEIDVTLQVGSESQKVTVTAGAPIIQTQDSSVGSLVDAATIVNTPLNGRLSIIGLIALAPGVQGAGSQDQIPVFGVTPSVGTGSRNSYGGVGFTLDGAVNTNGGIQRGEGEVPPLDGLAEFRVISSGVPAEFAQPTQITVVTKGGANALHGMLLEFNRVAATSAKNYFAGALPKPKYIRNEFGGNVSGPVYIPKLYDGRNRSFFFFNYEAYRLRQAASVNSQQPTPLERSGNFSEAGTIVDPLTGLPFANNTIPNSRLSTVDLKLQQVLFPLPTTSGIGTNTYELVPYESNATRYAVRMDHQVSEKDQLRGTMMTAFYGPNPSPGASSKAGGMAGIGEHNVNSIIGWTHIFSPSLLLDTTASYLHLTIFRTPQNYNVSFESIIPGLAPQLIEGAPNISIKNITGVGEAGSKNLDQTYQLQSTITKSTARHLIKAGVSFLYDNFWQVNAQSPQRGSYSFTGQYSGVGYADFLLGYPAGVQNPVPAAFVQRNISYQSAAFIQDDWKATQRMTINAGLRYDLQWFASSPYGNASLYIPSLQRVVVFGTRYPSATDKIPAIPQYLSLPISLSSQVGLPNDVFQYLGQDKNNVSPRLGFAYQVTPRTVLRGAFGIFYNFIPSAYIGNAFANVPFAAVQTFSQPAGPPSITMDAPFASTGAFNSNPSVYAQHKTVNPYTEAYNLTAEQDLGGGFALRMSYVGQHTLKQNNYGASNVLPDINLPSLAAGPVQPRRPVQPFSTISLAMAPIFSTNMNSIQVGLHKQYTSGVTLNAEYQFTHVLGTETFQNPATLNDSYGNVGGITPQVLQVSYSLPLPVGKGRRFLGAVSAPVDAIVGGWQLSGISAFQTGQPFSVNSVTGVQGSANSRADRVPGVPLYPSNKTKTQWFNAAAFRAPANFTYGNSAYNLLRGPGYQNWDMSLSKTTKFDRGNLQLRADAFNVFNHPNFGTPNATITNANVGTVTSQSGASRTMELGAKLFF